MKISFWFEWHATCFWSADDETREHFECNIEPEYLPLSPATIQKVYELIEWHDTALNWEYPPHPGSWRQDECDRFNRAAKDLLAVVREELKGYFTVIDNLEEEKEDPDLDAYLSDPKNFKR